MEVFIYLKFMNFTINLDHQLFFGTVKICDKIKWPILKHLVNNRMLP